MNVLNRIGPYNEALKLIEQAASGSPPKLAQQIFFRVLHARVLVLVQRQEPFTAVLEQLLEMDRAEAPEHLNILILLLQHSQALWRGDFQSSISILEDVLAYTRAHGFDVHTGQALSNLGIMHHTLEQADEAQACLPASLEILQPIDPGYLTARPRGAGLPLS